MAKPAKSKTSVTTVNEVAISAGSLAEIVSAGESGMFTSHDVHGPLLESGLVEINSELTNALGHVATRATAKGIESMTTKTETAAKPFEITFDFEPSKEGRTGSGGKTELYPFGELPAPNAEGKKASFFVAGKTVKAMSSTISGATRRFAEPVEGKFIENRKGETVPKMQPTRKFHGEDTVFNGVSGVRVFRDA